MLVGETKFTEETGRTQWLLSVPPWARASNTYSYYIFSLAPTSSSLPPTTPLQSGSRGMDSELTTAGQKRS